MPAQFKRKIVVAQTKVISSLSFLYVLENRSLANGNAVPTELNLGKGGGQSPVSLFLPFHFSAEKSNHRSKANNLSSN